MSPSTTVPRSIDVARLRRASLRRVKRLGPHRFLVEGKHAPSYLVDLELAEPCSCTDARMHGTGCLHELRARLSAGDDELVMLLGSMLAEAERAARTLGTRARKQRSA